MDNKFLYPVEIVEIQPTDNVVDSINVFNSNFTTLKDAINDSQRGRIEVRGIDCSVDVYPLGVDYLLPHFAVVESYDIINWSTDSTVNIRLQRTDNTTTIDLASNVTVEQNGSRPIIATNTQAMGYRNLKIPAVTSGGTSVDLVINYTINEPDFTKIERFSYAYGDWDISTWSNLTFLFWAGNNTGSGDISTLTNLTFLYWRGNNTGSGDISLLTNLTYLYWSGNNTGSGDISTLTNLTFLSWRGNNTGSGDISLLTNLTYLDWSGSNTGSGDISTLTNLTFLYWRGNNTGSGFGALALSATGLSYVKLGASNELTEAQIDTILINMNTNKSETKPRTDRYIELDESTHAAPSATGLAAKSALQAAGWTVLTN